LDGQVISGCPAEIAWYGRAAFLTTVCKHTFTVGEKWEICLTAPFHFTGRYLIHVVSGGALLDVNGRCAFLIGGILCGLASGIGL
jgi:hypothetical protein